MKVHETHSEKDTTLIKNDLYQISLFIWIFTKSIGFLHQEIWLKIGLIFGYKSYPKSSWSAVSSGFSTDHHEALRSCLPHRLQVTSVIIFIKLTQGCTRSLFTNHQIYPPANDTLVELEGQFHTLLFDTTNTSDLTPQFNYQNDHLQLCFRPEQVALWSCGATNRD